MNQARIEAEERMAKRVKGFILLIESFRIGDPS
jgi:hypothetical protein